MTPLTESKPTLTAEHESLIAEEEARRMGDAPDDPEDDFDRLMLTCASLRAENERLKQALKVALAQAEQP